MASRPLDLIGEQYGKLTVISKAEKKNEKTAWLCRCECGNTKVIRQDSLRDKNKPTRSCGCISSNEQDLTGMKFGRLTVLEDTGKRRHRKKIYKCQCYCGNETYVMSYSLNNGATKGCGCLKPIICSIVNKGKRHPNYNPDLTTADRLARRYILGNVSHKTWRREVFERDNYTCVTCGIKNGLGKTIAFNAHHIDGWNWCKEKRFDLNNGITLCKDCHDAFHKEYGSGDNTKEQFEAFINNKPTLV